MNLPRHGCETGEIVFTADGHPRQSIAAVDVTSHASAERTAAIVQGDLRNCAEKVLSRDFELGDFGYHQRRDAGTQDFGHATLGGDEAEHAISGGHQPPRETDALSLVTVKQLV